MISKIHAAAAAAALGGAILVAQPALAQQQAPAAGGGAGVRAGVLTCNVASGWGFVFGSTRDIRCTYSGVKGVVEHYSGHISKFGVDVGYHGGGVIAWAVIAPTAELGHGALAGSYGGVSGGASVGIGLGANVLVGGSNRSIALQPLSIEGMTGVNVAAGIGEITLRPSR